MKLNLVSETDLTRPEMDNIKLRLSRVEAKEISTVTLGAIPNSLLTAKGDLIVASAANTPARYGVVAPAAPAINVLGVANGEDTPTWKSASSAGAADAHLLATDADGYTQVVRLGVGKSPSLALDIVGNVANTTTTTAVYATVSTGDATTGRAIYQLIRNSGTAYGWDFSVNVNRDATDNFIIREIGGTGDGLTALSIGKNTRVVYMPYGSVIGQGLIVNEDGGGAATDDFRVESDTEANMLWLDASADLLYLGGSTGVKISKGGRLTPPSPTTPTMQRR